MYKNYIQRIVAVILLGVFTLNTVPREFIHLFAGHEDTQDQHWTHPGATVSGEHRHCDFLQIANAPYEQQTNTYFSPVRKLIWIFNPLELPETTHSPYCDLSPRAPPAFLS
ncbi:hypothetical protein [Chitinophaga solisilvae]|uniref:hypothetical protein n=1 Tax=Chitinophaga solisilvae TaxID=1233460 RepID=UPI001367C175|nr:hypothetical protein [Chitinophaga solisilvae]